MNSRFAILFFAVFLCVHASFGQFSRYWDESFSTKSALLSGAVVGGYQDETSIYYNPSILSDSSVNQFSFANGLFTGEIHRYDNGLGPGIDIMNTETKVDPGFLSINLYPKKKFGLVWKAAYFRRNDYDHGFNGDYNASYSIYPQNDSEEQYHGKVSTRTEFNDYWYGVGIAKFLNEKFSLGMSVFLRYTSLRYNYSKDIQIATINQDSLGQTVSVSGLQQDVRGYNWRGTLKLGGNYRINEIWRTGISITLPSISLISNADGLTNVTKVNVPNFQTGGLLPDYYLNATGENMRMLVKDPLGISVGVDYQQPKYRCNLTLGWFAAVDPYRLIDQNEGTVEVQRSNKIPNEGEEPLSYAAGGKSIANVAIGVEIYNKRNRSLLVGFKTDFDALNKFDYKELSEISTLSNVKSNYYHFSAGKNFAFLKFDVLFGIQYSISRQKNLPAYANFTAPIDFASTEPYSLEGEIQDNMNFFGDAVTIFVGLTIKN